MDKQLFSGRCCEGSAADVLWGVRRQRQDPQLTGPRATSRRPRQRAPARSLSDRRAANREARAASSSAQPGTLSPVPVRIGQRAESCRAARHPEVLTRSGRLLPSPRQWAGTAGGNHEAGSSEPGRAGKRHSEGTCCPALTRPCDRTKNPAGGAAGGNVSGAPSLPGLRCGCQGQSLAWRPREADVRPHMGSPGLPAAAAHPRPAHTADVFGAPRQ